MNQYDVAAYIWPAYTGDEPRTRTFWPEGMGEWQSVKNAVKKFPAHNWPRKPLWGYQNEANQYVMEQQIQAASDYGVNVFIYDWYWYDRRPFLENCLNDGYLKARNNDLVKFYLMWANHDVNNTWDIRNSSDDNNIIWQASIDRPEFERMARRIIEKYFHHPSYYKIDGKPVFMIYDMSKLIDGLGGMTQTADALAWFRKECEKSGLAGVHLQMVLWQENSINLSGVDSSSNLRSKDVAVSLAFDSVTHYQFVHFANINQDYLKILEEVEEEWKRIEQAYKIPYFPHISVGWDNNPRFREFREGIVKNNTPENVKKGFELAKKYIDSHRNQSPLITVNSWNEWTETSYLLPDDYYGYGYLEALKETFLPKGKG